MSEQKESAQARIQALRSASFEQLPDLCERYKADERKQVQKALSTACRRYEREVHERKRVLAMYDLMHKIGGSGIIVGVDEVGRGAVAGPLTVAAVALPDEPIIWGLNDSKKLSPQRREELAVQIADCAIAIGIAHIENTSIDAAGMAVSLRMAMKQAVEETHSVPDAVLVDGNPMHIHPREHALVKGDARVACIAAASIVAKVTRDALMVAFDAQYPGYHFAESKGYASPDHIAAIQKLGLTPLHRRSFCQNFLNN
ncbi:ribonuclease HII [Olsenella sp. Marseille-QA0557]|uniref:ribonuclease HII n=1 Tax=Olsenella sp. Marseille-QA0557 TaxID=3378782 RepID=UPI003D14F1E8